MVKARPIAERFWKKVKKTDTCWLWTGATHGGSWKYGIIGGPNNTTLRAHRLSWTMHHGQIPVGMFVCHHCDNPLCVNPSHLFLGSNADNVHDMLGKGRHRTAAKFTAYQVAEMRQRYASGELQEDIARAFGTTQKVVSRVVLGLIYRRAGGPIAAKKRPIVLRGALNGNAALTSDQVQQIRSLRAGHTRKQLAAMFGVSYSTIGNVLHGIAYKD